MYRNIKQNTWPNYSRDRGVFTLMNRSTCINAFYWVILASKGFKPQTKNKADKVLSGGFQPGEKKNNFCFLGIQSYKSIQNDHNIYCQIDYFTFTTGLKDSLLCNSYHVTFFIFYSYNKKKHLIKFWRWSAEVWYR